MFFNGAFPLLKNTCLLGENMIYLNKLQLNGFSPSNDGAPSSITAQNLWTELVEKTCGQIAHNGIGKVVFSVNSNDCDKLDVTFFDNTLSFCGGKRGVIYGVLEFYEKLCCVKFLTGDCTVYPSKDVFIRKVNIHGNSVVKFREILGNASDSTNDMLYLRLNSNAWHVRLTEEHGGGMSFAGIPAHSLTCDYLLKPFVETHPEYFCLIDGKRVIDRFSQVCFSADGVVDAITEQVFELLKKYPNATYVSVSQADSDHYCQCDECKKKYEKYSKTELFLQIVNHVADAVRQEYPNVLVHTFAYNKTCEPPKLVKPRDNVVIQYCIGSCKNHQFFDTKCPVNKTARKDFEKITNDYRNVIIWDYPNCFKYQMFYRPDVSKFRRDVRYFANHHVNGMFFEYVHRLGDGSCVFAELKTYLLAKLMWNPFVSKNTYNCWVKEFMHGYYGNAGKYLLQYINLYEKSINTKLHFNYDLCTEANGFDGKKTNVVFDLFDDKTNSKFFAKAYDLWNKAKKSVDGVEWERVDKDFLQLLYLDGIVNFDKVLAHGTEDEKAEALRKNKELCQGIVKYKIKITFWGEALESQLEKMEGWQTVSPRDWNYKW